jgi:hypothetical protein
LVVLRLRVFEGGNQDAPVNVDDPTDLLEIRTSDNEPAVRFGDWIRLRSGVYETTYTFGDSGDFSIVVLPDIEHGPGLPEGSTDQVTVVVEDVPSALGGGPSWGAIVASAALVLGVGAVVVAATRGRSRSPRAPVPNETWWNSP